jgi:diketogulonate reductase-like aldo/keto reductase
MKPTVGLGTTEFSWNGETKKDIAAIIPDAIKMGYRFIDLDETYDPNPITDAIAEVEINRSDLFISQKIYTIPTITETKRRTEKIEYLDLLYLANPPLTDSRITFNDVLKSEWYGMANVKAEKLVKNIGICNFHNKQLNLFLKLCDREELEYPDFALLEILPLI